MATRYNANQVLDTRETRAEGRHTRTIQRLDTLTLQEGDSSVTLSMLFRLPIYDNNERRHFTPTSYACPRIHLSGVTSKPTDGCRCSALWVGQEGGHMGMAEMISLPIGAASVVLL